MTRGDPLASAPTTGPGSLAPSQHAGLLTAALAAAPHATGNGASLPAFGAASEELGQLKQGCADSAGEVTAAATTPPPGHAGASRWASLQPGIRKDSEPPSLADAHMGAHSTSDQRGDEDAAPGAWTEAGIPPAVSALSHYPRMWLMLGTAPHAQAVSDLLGSSWPQDRSAPSPLPWRRLPAHSHLGLCPMCPDSSVLNRSIREDFL